MAKSDKPSANQGGIRPAPRNANRPSPEEQQPHGVIGAPPKGDAALADLVAAADAMARFNRLRASSGLRGLARRATYIIGEERGQDASLEDFSFNMDRPIDVNNPSGVYGATGGSFEENVLESYARVATFELESTYSYMIPLYETLNTRVDGIRLHHRLPAPLLPNIYALNMMSSNLLSGHEHKSRLHVKGQRMRELVSRNYLLEHPAGISETERDFIHNFFRDFLPQSAWNQELLNNYFINFSKKALGYMSGDPFWMSESDPRYEKGTGTPQAQYALEALIEKNKIIVLNEDHMNRMNELTDNVEVFPMHNRIKFSTDISTNLAEELREFDVASYLMPFIAERVGYDGYLTLTDEDVRLGFGDFFSRNSAKVEVQDINAKLGRSGSDAEGDRREALRKFELTGKEEDRPDPPRITEQFRYIDIDVVMFDFHKFLDRLGALDVGDLGNNLWRKMESGYTQDKVLDISVEDRPAIRVQSALTRGIKAQELRRRVKNKVLDLIPNRDTNYNETLFYEIVKAPIEIIRQEDNDLRGWGGVPRRGEVQRVFIPNFSSLDIAEYVDTQVHYGERCSYKVYAWEAVMGIDHHLSSDSPVGEVKIKLVRVPYAEPGWATMLDRPPMPPRVVAYPYVGVQDELLLSISAQTGEAFLKPDILRPGEESSLRLTEAEFRATYERYEAEVGRSPDNVAVPEMRENSNRKQKRGEELLFRSDESFTNRFEIYRMTRKPEKIVDFSGMLHKIKSTDMASNVAFHDTIEPNTKYYYAVRTVDPHNQASNLSHIYEIELVADELGTFYMTQRVLDLEEENMYERSLERVKKSFRRKLQILPSLRHRIVEEGRYSDDEDYCALRRVELGTEKVLDSEWNQHLWGQKFKVRITSKDSGRKLDLNVAFTTTHKAEGASCGDDNNE